MLQYYMSRSNSTKHPTKQALDQREHLQQPQTNNNLQEHLFVGGLKIKLKNMAEFSNQSKQTKATVHKRSLKSLMDPLKTVGQKPIPKSTTRKNPTEEVKITLNTIAKSGLGKQVAKQDQIQTYEVSLRAKDRKANFKKEKQQKQTQAKQTVQNQFVEKKMKLGNRGKSDAMKQFIIETLLKGKAEGNSLTIHKGTAQCINSPRKQFNKSQIPNHDKQKYSLVLVQQKSKSVVPKRKSFLPPLPQNRLKLAQGPESRKVSLAPSLNSNKKWVALAKKMQKKQDKQTSEKEKPNKEQQIIEQQIAEQNVSSVYIPQEIQE